MFASLQRVRRALSRNYASNFSLNSYSPGRTTIEPYNEQMSQCNEQPHEDPDYQVVVDPNMASQLKDPEKGIVTCAMVSVSNHDSS
jgi:hypothetical protein